MASLLTGIYRVDVKHKLQLGWAPDSINWGDKGYGKLRYIPGTDVVLTENIHSGGKKIGEREVACVQGICHITVSPWKRDPRATIRYVRNEGHLSSAATKAARFSPRIETGNISRKLFLDIRRWIISLKPLRHYLSP